MSVIATRKANLLIVLAQFGTLETLAELTASSARHLSQMKNGTRNMGHKVARRIEAKLGLGPGWMDTKHQDTNPAPGGQRQIDTEALVRDFEELPPLLQEAVSKKARELRELIERVSPEYRNAISAPPSDPERYGEWEGSIKALWSLTSGQPRPPDGRTAVKDKKK